MNKTIISYLPLLGLLISCGTSKPTSTDNLAPVPVEVVQVEATPQSSTITASGRLEAEQRAALGTRIMAQVIRVTAVAGQKVEKGQLLVQLSSTDLTAKKAQTEAVIKQAEAGFKNAEKDYVRFQALLESASISQKEFENVTAQYEIALAGLEAARQMHKEVLAQFAYTEIRSPFSGVVTSTSVKVGDLASPGVPLITVEGLSEFQAVLMIPEADISSLDATAPVHLLLRSTGRSILGTVREVSPSSIQTGGQFLVKVDLKEVDPDLRPGMFVNASFQAKEERKNTRILVSNQALIRSGQLTGIYVVTEPNTALLRWLRTGESIGDQVEVLSGLQAGETYVKTATGRLFNGSKISI